MAFIHRDSPTAILHLRRFDADTRPHLQASENTGTGYFARFFSIGTEVANLLTTGVLKIAGLIISAFGTGILHSDSSGNITSSALDLSTDTNSTALPVTKGGTGSTSAGAALVALGAMGTWVTAPVSHAAPGTAGQIAYDAVGNLYVCYATNQWAKFTGSTTF